MVIVGVHKPKNIHAAEALPIECSRENRCIERDRNHWVDTAKSPQTPFLAYLVTIILQREKKGSIKLCKTGRFFVCSKDKNKFAKMGPQLDFFLAGEQRIEIPCL